MLDQLSKTVHGFWAFKDKIDEYKNSFIKEFSNIDYKYLENKIFTLPSGEKDRFLQGLAEIIIYKVFHDKGLNIQHDVKLNLTKKDVDFVIDIDSCKLNIEVKCPVICDHPEGTLFLSVGHRYDNSKIVHESIFKSILEELKKRFGNNLTKEFNNIQEEKIDDNKLKDYLLSAQSKFNEKRDQENELNVLFIALTTNDFIRFFDYITNPQTGLFTCNSYVNPVAFNNIDCIVLSNVMSGHYKFVLDFNIWDCNNYINFLIPNINIKRNSSIYCNPTKAEKALLEIFHDELLEYKNFSDEFEKTNKGLPKTAYLTLPTYIKKYHPILSDEYTKKLKSMITR